MREFIANIYCLMEGDEGRGGDVQSFPQIPLWSCTWADSFLFTERGDRGKGILLGIEIASLSGHVMFDI